ncbi:MAG: Lrp/AsnC family transcriptional regulator [Candidatus Heimdallarchaeota archaeon]|nr:Lrp/AsnC family transcriptional regulator [Candidatus Heimdallarchaeota archaeon]RLI69148.1 MAG: Lrp/AsnC family transcriptional regulator [Candidatus Gerdarchaeota archaeon]RLI71808.1 MAG: Lrp/AsnC family transcriptional regulator [Candidatus Gerdarchaeota archaeon]RLI73506.1 MAG: Lrp/AsnC family transcriptional regulator [Candidatus Heimdallarchaeota archaeon]
MLDEKDRLILQELEKDARMPTKRIATKLDIPRVTVHSRIEKLKQEGVIRKFTIEKDFKKIGLPVTAFVFIEFAQNAEITQRKLAEKLARLPNVSEVHLISGEWDLLVKVRGATLEKIGEMVLDKIRPLPGVAKTTTSTSFWCATIDS